MRHDRKLVEQIRNGDHDALRICYVQYKDLLLTLAYALLHDRSLAEDVVHDVFVSFCRNIADFRLTGTLKAYLAACAVNRSRTLLRQRSIHAKAAATLEARRHAAEDTPGPLESQELTARIEQHLAALPPEQRETIVLRVNAGLKFREIAALQQTTVSTVQGRYRYGIDKLRSLLNGDLQ